MTFTPKDLTPLSHARKTLFPISVTGKPVSPATTWRWINKGVQTRAGHRVRLRVTYLGRVPMVSPEMVAEFFEELAEANRVDDDDQTQRESTDSKLRDLGIL